MRSLSTKLILVALVVSLVQAGLTAWFAQRSAETSFERFLKDEAQTEFATLAAQHFESNGSWNGVGESVQGGMNALSRQNRLQRNPNDPGPGPVNPPRSSSQPTPDRNPNQPPPREDRRRAEADQRGPPPAGRPGRIANQDVRRSPFALADASGTIILPAGRYRPGSTVDPQTLSSGIPIVVDTQVVGYSLFNDEALEFTPREEEFVASMLRALLMGAAIGIVVAIALSSSFSSRAIRSLRSLTDAAGRVSRGDFGEPVAVASKDEIGTLAVSFNEMSAALNESQELRRQMTADIAHDLRTPLTVLKGYLEAMHSGDLEATPERVALLHDEASHMSRMIEDLRLLSLADAGELQIRRQPTSIPNLLEGIRASFERVAETDEVTISTTVQPRFPLIEVDSDLIRRVLTNLVANAVQHAGKGGDVTVAAALRKTTTGREVVRISVADTGDGIAPEDLPSVFERFYRSDKARVRKDGGGTGLGLAISKALVNAHMGTIEVERTGSDGTTFAFELPLD